MSHSELVSDFPSERNISNINTQKDKKSLFSLKCAAFTLSEVLITLGVIGVVAAITMPTLIKNYQKQLTINKLKHFKSLLEHVDMMRQNDSINGNFQDISNQTIRKHNSQDLDNFFDIYYKPYMKYVNKIEQSKGLLVQLPDGTGMYFQKRYSNNGTKDMYIAFCTEYKHCQSIDSLSDIRDVFNTRTIFAFWINGLPKDYIYYNATRASMLQLCKNENYYCSQLILMDGMQIKNDYPW